MPFDDSFADLLLEERERVEHVLEDVPAGVRLPDLDLRVLGQVRVLVATLELSRWLERNSAGALE